MHDNSWSEQTPQRPTPEDLQSSLNRPGVFCHNPRVCEERRVSSCCRFLSALVSVLKKRNLGRPTKCHAHASHVRQHAAAD